MTADDIIDGILDREGEGVPPFITPGDRGGRTSWGISERWHPQAWLNGPPSRDEARAIYLNTYVRPFERVKDDALRVQLVDIAVLHGAPRALLLAAKALYGVNTTRPIDRYTELETGNEVRLNNALVAMRLQFIDQLSDAQKSQKQFEEGWESRALAFLR